MHTTFAVAALAAVALARPQGVTENISPKASAPAGCSASHSGSFQVQAVNFTTTAAKTKRSTCGASGILTVDLADGVLTDSKGRTGYIAANYQFQFDKPAQTGAIYTSGFSACGNGSLALGGSAVFYQCYSGGFYNLYDRKWAPQCNPILLDILPCSGSDSGVGQSADGQPTGTATGVVTQISDAQPQVSNAAPISQISDGQPQAQSAVALVTQISDGQVQAPTAMPISQISDGQVQAPTGAPVSQISDGQVQAPSATGAPVSQISDGQVQAPSATVAPVSQISDGQVQAPSATGAPVSQISDGQVQAPNATTGPVPFTGSASTMVVSQFSALLVAVVAVAFL